MVCNAKDGSFGKKSELLKWMNIFFKKKDQFYYDKGFKKLKLVNNE